MPFSRSLVRSEHKLSLLKIELTSLTPFMLCSVYRYVNSSHTHIYIPMCICLCVWFVQITSINLILANMQPTKDNGVLVDFKKAIPVAARAHFSVFFSCFLSFHHNQIYGIFNFGEITRRQIRTTRGRQTWMIQCFAKDPARTANSLVHWNVTLILNNQRHLNND